MRQRYCWQGINHQGKKLQGVIDAASLASAKTELSKQAIIVKKITKKRHLFFIPKIREHNITLFCQQLSTMLKAGIPLIQALDFAANNQSNYFMNYLILDIKKEVEQGLFFSEALQKQPKFFNELACSLVAVGEKSGALDLMLEKLASYKEKISTMKRKLQKVLTYPLIVLFIACCVTMALLIVVVPQFQSLFKSFGAELPLLTRIMIHLSSFLGGYWPIIFASFSALVLGLRLAKRRLLWLNFASDKIVLKLPILGSLFSKTIIARFVRTLAISFAAGLPLVEALGTVAGVTGNRIYAQATEQIRSDLFAGQAMHQAMENTKLFPSMTLQWVAIGEESGSLESMLNKIADFYEAEINNSLALLMNLLEPLIMAILGLVIGGLVIAMYLPIFRLGSMV